ncbi:MAG: hypothetical protein F4Z29_01885 [Gemmatimonadetes bacterium]|nr:hypothetical protein [Gemmatimonadota bacterium]
MDSNDELRVNEFSIRRRADIRAATNSDLDITPLGRRGLLQQPGRSGRDDVEIEPPPMPSLGDSLPSYSPEPLPGASSGSLAEDYDEGLQQGDEEPW